MRRAEPFCEILVCPQPVPDPWLIVTGSKVVISIDFEEYIARPMRS
jgi:hypothetical protein